MEISSDDPQTGEQQRQWKKGDDIGEGQSFPIGLRGDSLVREEGGGVLDSMRIPKGW